jgi:hypothetical protein
MQIDQATWKRVTKRIALLEDALENLNDWNQGLYLCLKMLARRNGSACGTDPMCVLMCGPGSRPRVIPDGISSEEIPGFYKLAEKMLTGDAALEFARRQNVLSELRQMREERLARQAKLSPPPGSRGQGGGMGLI